MTSFTTDGPFNLSYRQLVIVDPAATDTALDNEIDPESQDNQPNANFSPNEIAIVGSSAMEPPDVANLINANDFEKDLECANRQRGSPLYKGWHDKLNNCLSLAYALYLHVLIDPDKLTRLLEAGYFSQSRRRALSKDKVALAALQYVTRPETEGDRKSASAYATMLICAKRKGVNAKRFQVEMANVTLREARSFVRDLPDEKASEQQKAVGTPTLTVSYRSASATIRHTLRDAPFSTNSDRQLLAEKIVNILQKLHDQTP